jgi:dUTP pyrophosphatase
VHPVGVLSSQQIRALLATEPPLVGGVGELDVQLQPNGFDLRVESVAAFTDGGQVGASDADRRLAATRDLDWGADGYLDLAPGVYLARLAETVALPAGVMALAKPRSSLLRCGVAVHNAVWDAGYAGRSQVQLAVYNPAGFRLGRGARIVQMVFMTLEEATERLYAGRYQNEGLAGGAG